MLAAFQVFLIAVGVIGGDAGESKGGFGLVFRVVQFLPGASDAESHTCDGGGDCRSYLGNRRIADDSVMGLEIKMRAEWTGNLPDGRKVKYTYDDASGVVARSAKVEGSEIVHLVTGERPPLTRTDVEQRFQRELTA